MWDVRAFFFFGKKGSIFWSWCCCSWCCCTLLLLLLLLLFLLLLLLLLFLQLLMLFPTHLHPTLSPTARGGNVNMVGGRAFFAFFAFFLYKRKSRRAGRGGEGVNIMFRHSIQYFTCYPISYPIESLSLPYVPFTSFPWHPVGWVANVLVLCKCKISKKGGGRSRLVFLGWALGLDWATSGCVIYWKVGVV